MAPFFFLLVRRARRCADRSPQNTKADPKAGFRSDEQKLSASSRSCGADESPSWRSSLRLSSVSSWQPWCSSLQGVYWHSYAPPVERRAFTRRARCLRRAPHHARSGTSRNSQKTSLKLANLSASFVIFVTRARGPLQTRTRGTCADAAPR